MADFTPRPGVSKVPKPRRMRYIWISLIIIAAALVLTYISLPVTPVNESQDQVTYTQEQIEAIANNSLSNMRGVILANEPVVAGCIAVETDNLSVCSLLDTQEKEGVCYKYNSLYYIFTGKCEELGLNTEARFQAICEGLDSGSCGSLSGDNKAMCESMLESDVAKCISVSSGFNMSSGDCQEIVYEYRAVKENDMSYCSNIPAFYKKHQCEAFVSGGCESFLNEVANDWVYFSLSRDLYGNRTDSSLCRNIIHQEIRDQCYDVSISYINAIEGMK